MVQTDGPSSVQTGEIATEDIGPLLLLGYADFVRKLAIANQRIRGINTLANQMEFDATQAYIDFQESHGLSQQECSPDASFMEPIQKALALRGLAESFDEYRGRGPVYYSPNIALLNKRVTVTRLPYVEEIFSTHSDIFAPRFVDVEQVSGTLTSEFLGDRDSKLKIITGKFLKREIQVDNIIDTTDYTARVALTFHD